LRLSRQRFPETLVRGLTSSVLALFLVSAILGGQNLAAQTHALLATKPVQQQKAAQPGRSAPEAIAAQSFALPAPIGPANQPPNQAKVTWDGRGLEIEASNSSLNQILHQVAADTGAKLEGLAQDQRIFGSYGPGPGSDVLWKLLDGSGYNVLLIGGSGCDAPLEIVLSVRSSTGLQTAATTRTATTRRTMMPTSRPNPICRDPGRLKIPSVMASRRTIR
jgi:hypothetical protein